MPTPASPTAEDEVVGICRDLLRIDSSNYGDGSGPGERAAAEYIAASPADVGLEPEVFESAPRRTSVVVRLPGTDASRPALVLHGHTDVVPAEARDWQVDPFAGEERDGMLWGRGAVDMKDMDAMILAVVRQMAREGRRPARDVVIAMFADEEAGGVFGARWAVDNRPELFAGATEAISEVGGFSVDVGGHRTYLLQTAEKGIGWLRLVADGYGIPMERTLAIGDASNDIEMLEAAGAGVAMGNAPEEVKAVAHWVAPSNNEEGVLAALRRFGIA